MEFNHHQDRSISQSARTTFVMLASLNRWMRRYLPPDPQGRVLHAWAQQHGEAFKRARDGTGYVVQGQCGVNDLRVEWGPSQRHYLHEQELRVRIQSRMPETTEIMVVTKALAERLEVQAYERLVQGQQTELSFDLPEEVRWLASLRQLPLQEWPTLAAHFVVVSSMPTQAQRWLEGEVASRLGRAVSGWLGPTAPLVLMLLNGRIYLRTEADVLDEPLLDGMRSLAEAAMLRAVLLDLRRHPVQAATSTTTDLNPLG
jgi:hypothetical protein